MNAVSRTATLSLQLGIAAVALLVLGPALCQVGAGPMIGFYIFGVGLLCGLIALPLGAIGLWLTRPAARKDGRGQALSGCGLGILVLAIVAVAARPGDGVPPINDITTDINDPPAFVAAQDIEANRARDLDYPGAEFSAQQQAGYPDLAPEHLDRPPAQALADARAAGEMLGWDMTYESPADGHLEATDTTRFFRFVDDIVIRVRPDGTGSIVDIRSKSRDGKGDLGANAARIRAFQGAMSG